MWRLVGVRSRRHPDFSAKNTEIFSFCTTARNLSQACCRSVLMLAISSTRRLSSSCCTREEVGRETGGFSPRGFTEGRVSRGFSVVGGGGGRSDDTGAADGGRAGSEKRAAGAAGPFSLKLLAIVSKRTSASSIGNTAGWLASLTNSI